MRTFTAASLAIVLLSFTRVLAPAAEPPVKVFILAGQSNMEGHGFIAADAKRNDGRGSLEFLAKDPASAVRFKRLLAADGQWVKRDDVWITYLDRSGPLTAGYGARPDRIGPELGFGWVVGEAFQEPVVLIKCAWGGKSLAVDFRPPSAGKLPYSLGEKNDEAIAADPAIVGRCYRETLALTRAALAQLDTLFPALKGRGYELAGMGWHQGWNDRINDRFNAEYAANLAHLIRDLRRDLDAPKLPFVIAETGMTGPEEKHPRALSLMQAQASVAELPEFRDNVAFVPTRAFWRPKEESPTSQGYHWNSNAETYYLIGDAMGRAMLQLCGTESKTVTGTSATHVKRDLEGWIVWVNPLLLEGGEKPFTELALDLLAKQLAEIRRVVPAHHVKRLQEVPLWINPPYEGTRPKAEYHPAAGWLRANRRDPAMERAVEFTNTRIWERENRRMPMLALHELAHAYHHRVIGHDHEGILGAFAAAKEGGRYESVKRWNGEKFSTDRAYALSNEKEYFAETTEAFFGRNDFEPFDRDELKAMDPRMYEVLREIWK
jgi:hypothetical protein